MILGLSEEIVAAHINSHFSEKRNELRFKDEALRVSVHDAKLID